MMKDEYGRIFLGDIILEINGSSVNNLDDIFHQLDKYKVGQEVTITYLRKNKKLKTKLKLQEL